MSPKHTLAVTTIIEYEGKFLFIQRREKDTNFSGKWVFPGGKVEAGEDAVQALVREVIEETGVRLLSEAQLLSSYMFYRAEDASSTVGEVFLLRAQSAEYHFDEKSYQAAKWILPEEVYDFDTIYGMEVHVRNAVIALRTQRPLGYEYMSVTEYQRQKCSMTKEYLQELQKTRDIQGFLVARGGALPHL
jgi:mutator protein MutT